MNALFLKYLAKGPCFALFFVFLLYFHASYAERSERLFLDEAITIDNYPGRDFLTSVLVDENFYIAGGKENYTLVVLKIENGNWSYLLRENISKCYLSANIFKVLKANNSYAVLGSYCGVGPSFYFALINKNGLLICNWTEDNKHADEIIEGVYSNDKFNLVGRKSSHYGIYIELSPRCKVLRKYEWINGYGNRGSDIFLLNSNEAVIPQTYYDKNSKNYAFLVERINLSSFKSEWKLRETKFSASFDAMKANDIIFSNGYFITGGGSIFNNASLIAFTENGTMIYFKVYPFKGVLRHGDIGWRNGTVIYAGDNGFTAYLFNATNGELLAFYNSSLKNKAVAFDVKRDFIDGCYVLVGAEQTTKSNWRIRIERICEFKKMTVDFNYVANGLNVSFNPLVLPKENITKYFWNFGDGKYSFEKNPVHAFPGEGNYTVTLTIENEQGRQEFIRKNIFVESLFQEINFEDIILQNQSLRVKVKLKKTEKIKIEFANFSAIKKGETIFQTFPTNISPGIYFLTISSPYEKLSFPVRILNESEYEIYLEFKNLKHLAEIKSFEISRKLGENTLNVASFYALSFAGSKISEVLDNLYQKLVNKVEKEIIRFSEVLKRISKKLGEYVESRSKEFAENIVSNIFEKTKEFGEELGKESFAFASYSVIFKPEIESFEEGEKILTMNYEEMKRKIEKAHAYLQSLERIPVYNFSLFYFEVSPNIEYFLEKTEKSVETSEIAPPWDLFDLVVADAQSILTVPVALEIFNETERGKFRIKALPVAAIIAAAKAYIQISTTITKISPAILLFGSYTSSYIASRDIVPEIFSYTGYEAKGLKEEYVEIYISKGNIVVKGASQNEKNLYLSVSQANKTYLFVVDVVNSEFIRNFSFKVNSSGSYLVKACLFSGAKKVFCDVKSFYILNETKVAGLIVNSSGIFVRNLYSDENNISLVCNNAIYQLKMSKGEEKRVNCSGEVKLFIDDKIWDKEVIKDSFYRLNYCTFKKFVRNNKINILCKVSKGCEAFLIYPSGMSKKIYGNETVKENGSYFIEIKCKNSTLYQGCFVRNEKSKFILEKKDGYLVVKNEYNMPVKNVKVVINGIERFTNKSGVVYLGNSSLSFISHPCFENKFINLNSKKFISLPDSIEVLESYGISWINITEIFPENENVFRAYEIKIGNSTKEYYVVLKFNLNKSFVFTDKNFSIIGNCCILNISSNLTVFLMPFKPEAKIEIEKCEAPFVYFKIINYDSEKIKICEIVNGFRYCKNLFAENKTELKEKFIILDKEAKILINGKLQNISIDCFNYVKFSSHLIPGVFKLNISFPFITISGKSKSKELKIKILSAGYMYLFSMDEGKTIEKFTSSSCIYEKVSHASKTNEKIYGVCKELNRAREIRDEMFEMLTQFPTFT